MASLYRRIRGHALATGAAGVRAIESSSHAFNAILFPYRNAGGAEGKSNLPQREKVQVQVRERARACSEADIFFNFGPLIGM